MPAHVVTVSNQKGGVGKTTTVVNFAAFAALAGKRTLVIDNDPQGNASSVLAPGAEGGSIYQGRSPLPTRQDKLWIIPASTALIDEERQLARQERGRFVLRDRLEPLKQDFDLVVIDCPPNLSFLPVNALLASDSLLLPLQAEYYALEGLTQLLAFLDELQSEWGSRIKLLGILLTMATPGQVLAEQVAGEVRKHFGDKVVKTVIPRDVALAAAPSHGQSILDHDPLSPGGLAYAAASKELLDAIGR